MNATQKELLADTLGRRLRESRESTGKSLRDLVSGDNALNASAVSLLERGRKMMTIPQLIEIAQAIGVKPGELLDAAVEEVGR